MDIHESSSIRTDYALKFGKHTITMTEKKDTMSSNAEEKSIASTPPGAKVASADQPLETMLQRLPSHYRKEIMKQYDLPETKVGLMTILRYATPVEVGMQILGLLCAIAAGITLSVMISNWLCRRCSSAYDYYVGKFDELVWWVYFTWDTEYSATCYGRGVQSGGIMDYVNCALTCDR